jgi:mannitol-1-phosphate 5-dehydrogenase
MKHKVQEKKIVIFGAGKIGRSFIGQLFSRSGFFVVFVDINRELADNINRAREYRVVIKKEAGDEVLLIKNVRGIGFDDPERVICELASAGIAAFCVGQNGLPHLLPVVAKALERRQILYGNQPLDFIIAENMRNADQFIKEELRKYLPGDYPFERLVGLVETSIGKMVPIMTQKDLDEDPLQVFAEPYNTLIVSRNGFKNPIPAVDNLAPKDHIKAWVDRKLFIHNLGHASAAYLGYGKHPGAVYLYEVLADRAIAAATRLVMLQSAEILMSLYPGEFTPGQITGHIDDLLRRFSNKALGDTVFRVGCDLYRKLGPGDRLVTPIESAIRMNKPYDLILDVLLAAISFRATDEHGRSLPSDEAFFKEAEKGTGHVLRNICMLELTENQFHIQRD